MNFIIILFTILQGTFLISLNKDKLSKRISKLFFIVWIMLSIISLLNPKGLKEVGSEVYLYISIFIIMFLSGLIIPKQQYNFSINNNINRVRESFDMLSVNKWILLFVFIADIFLLIFSIRLNFLLSTMSAIEYRNTGGLQNILFGGNSLLGLTYTFLVSPMSFFSNIFLAYLILFKRKAIIPIILYLSYIVLRTILEGQRSGLVDIFIFFAFFIYCSPYLFKIERGNSVKKQVFKDVLIIAIIGVIALGFLSYMTNQRLNNVNEFSLNSIKDGIDNTLEHLITYSVGPFRAFDYALSENYFDKLNGYKLGRSTLGFIDYSIQLVARNLGLEYKAANSEIYRLLQDNWINIPQNFNFAYTSLFNFYMDFGLLGILFIPYLLGGIIKKFIIKYHKKFNPIIFLVIAYMFYAMINSYFTWIMYEMSAFVTILWFFILNAIYKKDELSKRGS